jgi:hypothetical protein
MLWSALPDTSAHFNTLTLPQSLSTSRRQSIASVASSRRQSVSSSRPSSTMSMYSSQNDDDEFDDTKSRQSPSLSNATSTTSLFHSPLPSSNKPHDNSRVSHFAKASDIQFAARTYRSLSAAARLKVFGSWYELVLFSVSFCPIRVF